MISLFPRLPPASVDKCKSTTNMQLETKTQNECVGVSHVVDDGPYGAVTDAFVVGTCVETQLDTGAVRWLGVLKTSQRYGHTRASY